MENLRLKVSLGKPCASLDYQQFSVLDTGLKQVIATKEISGLRGVIPFILHTYSLVYAPKYRGNG